MNQEGTKKEVRKETEKLREKSYNKRQIMQMLIQPTTVSKIRFYFLFDFFIWIEQAMSFHPDRHVVKSFFSFSLSLSVCLECAKTSIIIINVNAIEVYW